MESPEPDADLDDASTQPFGDGYRLVDVIGRGDNGYVYRARIVGGDAEVAVKILDDVDVAAVVAAWERERTLLQGDTGLSVVRIEDVVRDDGEVAVVSELVQDGRAIDVTFATMTDPELAARLLAEVARAVAGLHEAGLVHGRLTAANVLVVESATGPSTVHVTDHGLQRLLRAVSGPPLEAPDDVRALGRLIAALCALPDAGDVPVDGELSVQAQWESRLRELVLRMVEDDPSARPTADEAARALDALADWSRERRAAGSSAPSHGVPPSESPAMSTTSPVVTLLPGDGAPGQPAVQPSFRPGAALDDQVGVRSVSGSGDRSWYRRPALVAVAVSAGVLLLAGSAFLLRPSNGPTTTTLLPVTATSGQDPGSSADPVSSTSGSAVGAPTTSDPAGTGPAVGGSGPTGPGASGPASGTRADGSTGAPGGVPRTGASVAGASSVRPGTSQGVTSPTVGGGTAGAGPSVAGPSVGTGTTAAAVSHLAPDTPVLQIYQPTPGAMTSSDSRTPLAISHVVPNEGTIASITVRGAGRSYPITDPPTSTGYYYYNVTGLTNGQSYTFTVEVCTSFAKCATSAAVSFVPYGTPRIGTITGSAQGLKVSFAWTAVEMNFNPAVLTCTVTVTGTPADSAAPKVTASTAPGSLSFTGKPSTSYTAQEYCTNYRLTDAVTSAPVTTAAA